MPASVPHHIAPAKLPAPGPTAVGSIAALRTWATAGALHFGFDQLVRRGLRGVWLRGQVPAGPVVLAANHHSWWDAFTLLAVLRGERRASALVMASVNLDRFRYLRTIGVLSDRELRAAVAAVRSGRVMIIFPEGELRTAGPVAAMAPGAAWLARRAPATLVVAAVRVAMRGHQSPEAFVDLVPCPGDPAEVGPTLATAVRALDGVLAGCDPERPPGGFRLVVRGRRDWDERLSRSAVR